MLTSSVRRGVSVRFFCLGLMLGGLTISAAFLVGGSIIRPLLPLWLRVVIIAPFVLFIFVRELGHFSQIRMPENRRLVPETVFGYGDRLGPLQFGFEMGTGVRTYLPSGLPYVTALSVAFFATPWLMVSTGVAFGLGRSMMTVAYVRYDEGGGWDLEWLAHRRLLIWLLTSAFLWGTALMLWDITHS